MRIRRRKDLLSPMKLDQAATVSPQQTKSSVVGGYEMGFMLRQTQTGSVYKILPLSVEITEST